MKTNRPLALLFVTIVTLKFSTSPLHAQVATTGDVSPSPSVSPTWDLAGTALTIGNSATGTLAISSGGLVSSLNGVLGFNASGNGTVTVTGGTWNSASALLVGRAGAGSLAVSGGLVSVDGTTTTGFFGGSTGLITLSGTSGNRGTLSTNQVAENSGTGTVAFDGGILQARAVQGNFLSGFEPGDVTIDSGGAFIDSNGFAIGISTVLSGTGGLTKQGAGTLTLTRQNAYTGGTTVEAGTLSQGGNAFVDNTAYTVNGGTLELQGWALIASSLSGLGGTVDVGWRLTVDQSVDTTYAGVISGESGELIKRGTGTLTLSGDNTYANRTEVDAGKLILTGSNSYSGGTNIYGENYTGDTGDYIYGGNGGLVQFTSVDNLGSGVLRFWQGGTLQWAAGNTADISDRLYFAPTSDSSATFDTNGNNVIFASNFSNKDSLIKEGLGNLTLTGTHSGSIKIKHGTLTIGATGAVSGSSIIGDTTGDVGALQFSGGSLSSGGGRIGNAAGSQGTATVTSGSWTNSARLFVGVSGTGTLLINGGTVSDIIGQIGFSSGVSGITYGAEWNATLQAGDWQPVPDTGSAPEHVFSMPISGDRKFLRLTVVPSPL